jgi:hypothetical protein
MRPVIFHLVLCTILALAPAVAFADGYATQDPADEALPTTERIPETLLTHELASAVAYCGELKYRLSVEYCAGDGLYCFGLLITNLGDQPVSIEYATGERFDFTVFSADQELWHANINRFFVQAPFTRQLAPLQECKYEAWWDGRKYNGQPSETETFSVRAKHSSSSHALMLQLDTVPMLIGKWASQKTYSSWSDWSLVWPGDWTSEAMRYLSDHHALPGYPQDYFSGKHVLYRLDFAIALARALEYAKEYPPTDEKINVMLESLHDAFSEQIAQVEQASLRSSLQSSHAEIPTNHWAYAALDALARKGMLEGYPEGFFSGDRTLTRYDFAQAVARLLDRLYQSDLATEPIDIALAEALRAEFKDCLMEINMRIQDLSDTLY